MLKIGLTGGIASGKSQVAKLFEAKDVTVIDADEIARGLFAQDSPLLSVLRQKFGDRIFLSNGQLDRKALGNIVFNSVDDLNWLNDLTHPLVSQEMKAQIRNTTSHYVILDIPLLVKVDGKIPSHLAELIDRILVVDLNVDEQMARLIKRDQISQAQALAIIDKQSSREQKLALADDIIDNNGTIENLSDQVNRLHDLYLNLPISLPK